MILKTHFTSSFKLFMAINDMKAVARSRSSSEYVFAEIRFLDLSLVGIPGTGSLSAVQNCWQVLK